MLPPSDGLLKGMRSESVPLRARTSADFLRPYLTLGFVFSSCVSMGVGSGSGLGAGGGGGVGGGGAGGVTLGGFGRLKHISL